MKIKNNKKKKTYLETNDINRIIDVLSDVYIVTGNNKINICRNRTKKRY